MSGLRWHKEELAGLPVYVPKTVVLSDCCAIGSNELRFYVSLHYEYQNIPLNTFGNHGSAYKPTHPGPFQNTYDECHAKVDLFVVQKVASFFLILNSL